MKRTVFCTLCDAGVFSVLSVHLFGLLVTFFILTMFRGMAELPPHTGYEPVWVDLTHEDYYEEFACQNHPHSIGSGIV